MNKPSAYERFAPFIREYIYREKWSALHSIQEEAANEIFDGKDHLLIAAGTASGKTEAAFFPVLSVLETIFRSGGKPLVLYVSPLKALINDQAQRLGRLLRAGRDSEETAIPVTRWHGDVDVNSKSRFLEEPWGVLLITPESLEALLLRRPRELGRIFKELLFTVIDEVHVFMGSDRGSQLICQLARIEKAVTERTQATVKESAPVPSIRRIGLSATLGDYDGGRRWLSQGTNLSTALAGGGDSGKELSLALDYHDIPAGKDKGEAFYRSLYGQCRNKRVIIFTNSRLEAEECAASLNNLSHTPGAPCFFQIHHGSVSALLRDEAEEQLKSGEGPKAICATATLELGIDIGDLDRIIQLGPPWSVSAFVQRLGRSGRRSGRAEMYFSVTGPPAAEGSPAARTETHASTRAETRATTFTAALCVPWELLRTMAVIQLYLEEKWIEPPEEKPLPFSLLIHQTFSILASLGEHSPAALALRVLALPPFKNISPEDFFTLTAHLTDCGCIGTTDEGTLILGLEGERIVNRHSFYPVFPGDETFRVMLDGREIGTVNFAPDPLSVLAVGGRRWTVKSIDPGRREIWVAETGDEGGERLWRGRGGGTHPRIAETIKRILTEPGGTAEYAYLSAPARRALENGRNAARIPEIGDNPLISCKEDTVTDAETNPEANFGTDIGTNSRTDTETDVVLLFPWTGSAGMRTIAAVLGNEENKKQLKIVNLEEEAELYFRIATKLPLEEFRPVLIEACRRALGTLTGLIRMEETPYTDKYDYLLPPPLLAKQYAANMLDGKALEKLLARLENFSNNYNAATEP